MLAGGRSSRMGEDKALLPFAGGTLIAHVAGLVEQAAGSVAVVGDPARYAFLGYRVIPDNFPGQGPLAGIEAALAATGSDWNLVVACDMPGLSVAFLRQLLETAGASGADCLLPHGPSGLAEPLCAVYHRRALGVISGSLQRGVRKITDGLAGLRVAQFSVGSTDWFINVNTPAEWASYSNG